MTKLRKSKSRMFVAHTKGTKQALLVFKQLPRKQFYLAGKSFDVVTYMMEILYKLSQFCVNFSFLYVNKIE